MPVLTMSEVGWDNGQENGGGHRPHNINNMGPRSQDDAMVGYFFQRPQTDAELSSYNTKRWAVGDDSMIEQSRNVGVNELERDFQGLSVGRDIAPHGKKIWDIEDPSKGGNQKGVFHQGSPWAAPENSWDSPQGMVEHAVSQPIQMQHQRRPGSFPSNDTHSVLSPRSETSALGVNMVEYVLGGSPTGKELDNRLRMKGYPGGKRAMFVPPQEGGQDAPMEKKTKTPSPFEGGDGDRGDMEGKDNPGQPNGILQNGLDDAFIRAPGSRNTSPTHDDGKMHMPHPPMGLDPQKMVHGRPDNNFLEQPPHLASGSSGFHLDPPPFEPVGIDPMPFDYPSQLVSSMDSPNFNMDYTQQQLLQRQQQPIAVLTQQQYALAAQQQQLGSLPPSALTAPYVINTSQDPYATAAAVGIPFAGPAVIHPQYYGVQTPWGIYPANIIQQQGQATPQQAQLSQQQMLRGQNGRPLTPSQQNDNMGNTNNTLPAQALQTPGAGYQILAPAYYDQNGQLVMGNPRGIGTPVRLVSPAPVLVSAPAAGNQQGGANNLGNNPLRLLSTQSQGGANQQVLYPNNNNSNTPQSNAMGYTPSNSLSYTPVSTSLFTPISSGLGLTPQQSAFGNNNMGSSTPGTIGSGLNGQRRDSLDFVKQQRPLPTLNQYYTSLGGMAGSPAGPMGLVQPGQSITPPPSLTGSNSNLSLGFGNGRMPSAAPGAENKYRNGPMSAANGLFGGNSLFPARNVSRSASLSKEVTGRSRLLEDFRNNRIPNLQLKDLVNHVVEFSQDQHGSRFIQQKLERASPAEKVMVFGEILTAAYSLMTDVFGNYVIQKFFEFGSADQKQTLAQRVRGHVLPLALQMYGCRVIQKALESIPADMQVEIVKELDGHVLKCVKDQNGNHVVQKCIECVDPTHLQFIIDAFKGQVNVYTLSTHPYGCRVIQRILEHCMTDQTTPILEELHEQVERLVQDQYGNYVVQHVLEHGRPEDKSKIIGMIRGKVLLLSQHKFASNVVEKCVSHSSRAEKAMLIEEVCSVNDGALYTMMKDQFANYVVQKMIDVAEPPQRKILMHKIRPHVATLRKYTYGKHILTKLEKFLLKNNPDLGPIGMPPNGAMP